MGEKEDERGPFRGCRIATMISNVLRLRTIHMGAMLAVRRSACQFNALRFTHAGIGPQGVSVDPRPQRHVFKGLHGSNVKAIIKP
jgi:hypothetical protein